MDTKILVFADKNFVGIMEIEELSESEEAICLVTGMLNGEKANVFYMRDLNYGILIKEGPNHDPSFGLRA